MITTRRQFILIVFYFMSFCAAAQNTLEFGTIAKLDDVSSSEKKKYTSLKWVNVNTAEDTWSVKNDTLYSTGLPIGVMRSEKQYENFILHVEWRHMEKGGNSGVFVWSKAVPDSESRLPDGVEVQMLELGWVELNTKDGVAPPIAYVHGELFGVGGVKTDPDNPRGERSKSVENRCKGKGEWNTYDVVCVDGTIKLSVNGKFVNGIRNSTQRKGYLCLEAEGAKIEMRNFRMIELP
jgi:3-keto-disaccharide hydrolase